MIVCICNNITQKQLDALRDSCRTRCDFVEAFKCKMRKNSCCICYDGALADMEEKRPYYWETQWVPIQEKKPSS